MRKTGDKIGDKELVFAETFITLNEEVASFVVDITLTATLTFTVQFVGAGENPAGTLNWTWEQSTNTIRIKCFGWNNPLGTGLGRPVVLGDVQGVRFAFVI